MALAGTTLLFHFTKEISLIHWIAGWEDKQKFTAAFTSQLQKYLSAIHTAMNYVSI
jgi:hypothetical protein